jgi:hypothetical protein
VNWGTHACPRPTLNLEPNADAVCVGIAFEFPEERRDEVEAYLATREGKNFVLFCLEIIAKEAGSVQALVPQPRTGPLCKLRFPVPIGEIFSKSIAHNVSRNYNHSHLFT